MLSRAEAYLQAKIQADQIECNNRHTEQQMAEKLKATLEVRIDKAIAEGKFGIVHQCKTNERVLFIVREEFKGWDFNYTTPVSEKKDTTITIGWGI